MTGALVCGGSFLMIPGNRKSNGETVREALMPPQPPSSSGPADSRAKYKNFQRILTCRV